LTTIITLCLGSNVLAQQKQQVSFKVPAENSKYIVSQNVDVGDVPNHIVRLFDTHLMLPNNAATINGLKLVEVSARGTADVTDGYGSTAGYFVFGVEDGDKFFAHSTSVLQSASGKITVTTVGHIVGGTGTARGNPRCYSTNHQHRSETGGAAGDAEYEIEYSITK
jgi:hypothetical protein